MEEQQVVLVTGASTGIGRSTALRWARLGYRVVATMRDVRRADPLKRLSSDFSAIDIRPLDVDDPDAVSRLFDTLALDYGRLDVLVNNAGVSDLGTLEDTPLERWRSIFETNVFGVVRCCQAALPLMRRRRRGAIVNISSIAGRMTIAGQAAYSASKFALEGLSESLAQEVGRFGIRVVIIEPGVTATPILMKGTKAPTSSPYGAVYANHAGVFGALRRNAQHPDAVAEAVVEATLRPRFRLRWPVGEDAERLVDRRLRLEDEAWIALESKNGNVYRREFGESFGLEIEEEAV